MNYAVIVICGVVGIIVLISILAASAKKRVMKKLLEKAEQGDAQSQVILANKFLIGEGMEKNPEKAVDWFKKAAEQGSADAHYKLAICLKSGTGTQKDIEQANKHFQQAADKGHKEAQLEAQKAKIEAMTAEDCYNTGITYLKEEKLKEAMLFLENAQSKSGANRDIRYLAKIHCGIVYFKQRDFTGAYILWDELCGASGASHELKIMAKGLMDKMHAEGLYHKGSREGDYSYKI